jgi:hypothetical protein
VTGSVAGVIRNSPPLLFGLGSGLQWFALGTTYWGEFFWSHETSLLLTESGTRNFIFQAWDTGKGLSKGDKASASAIAGGVAGSGVGLLTRTYTRALRFQLSTDSLRWTS